MSKISIDRLRENIRVFEDLLLGMNQRIQRSKPGERRAEHGEKGVTALQQHIAELKRQLAAAERGEPD